METALVAELESGPKGSDVGYVTRLVDEHTAVVQKWEEDELAAEYTIRYGQCTCPSGRNRGECKHRDIVLRARNRVAEPMPREQAEAVAGGVAERLSRSAGICGVSEVRYDVDDRGHVTLARLTIEGRDLPESMVVRGYHDGLAFLVRCVRVE